MLLTLLSKNSRFSLMSTKLTSKPSIFSLAATQTMSGSTIGPAKAISRSTRPCSNCTCSPGLLSRQNRRTSALLRQFRRSSSHGDITRRSSSDSIYSIDNCNKNVNTTKRLESLRYLMKDSDIAVYIIPSEDEHNSEYVSLADQRRSFISGFTGSAGIAIITRDLLNFNETPEGKSALSTDGRYFNQAGQELDYNWLLLKQGAAGEPTWQEWAINEAIEQSLGIGKLVKIGIDPKVISYKAVQSFQATINRKIEESGSNAKVELVAIKENLVDKIWDEFEPMPVRPANDLIKLDLPFSGEDFQAKLGKLTAQLKKDHQSSTILVSALDEIAWFLNLRGSDIEYNPVFFSYLIVSETEIKLFVNNPISEEISKYLKENNITVHKYEEIWSELSSTATVLKQNTESIAIPETASWEIVRTLNYCKFKQIHSPIDFLKAIKNETEIKNMETAHLRDGIALSKYFSWLEHTLIKEENLIDEYSAALKLIAIRKELPNYQGNSFETISSTGANAAVIHYSPPQEDSAMIDPSKIYLCDSGSQFLEGTTDITRTLHFTTPSQEEIDNYTLVLKGNLAVEQLIFPEGTNGYMIDVLARQFLWKKGLDYRHGTGHGVGSFLNVHEGPIGISFRQNLIQYPLQRGNIITNEPGYYEDGKYGIRIENDMLVEETSLKFGESKFLKFRNLTLVPYNKNLINVKLLSDEEKKIVNEYHANIWKLVGKELDVDSVAHKWLKRETSPL
ncbi:hypothetical protein WICPIJ_002451 [Wickerhamomyces pijperi]|uniref:Xaa-Pro aminopeptidase n=1 Tax=Wickerhamomyces pijperi TaxID=599730 RepID=A0A9P8TPT3_WICPI|nr:hypothetical protein WICPIJ_002451 [Wickerhamomyces pijperi]